MKKSAPYVSSFLRKQESRTLAILWIPARARYADLAGMTSGNMQRISETGHEIAALPLVARNGRSMSGLRDQFLSLDYRPPAQMVHSEESDQRDPDGHLVELAQNLMRRSQE
ncbi:hypothetical protein MELA_02477 [Candidatus Methylomirabilis lanthanidiphila]|uniref:Uncharacterized protein n=1 Tax=Candidatus Methylomirabilis lanthanidiphila TaxID=2211376 RepID=A0A564ZLN5_9BACT|nr:hypothetical protein MELA_02477 [Candidatus Methylomirabilis lanthanidiphila]